jgi:iron complex transport system ATP-binding protein
VAPGEWFAVIGPNGAGKTTLFKCLMRVHPGANGTVRIDGVPARKLPQRRLAALLSYVPQQTGSDNPFRVEEFVLMGRYPHLSLFSTIGAADRRAAREAMELAGIAHLADRRMATLSGGERQAAAIASALAQGAAIMLLDEPAAFLDPGHAREVYRLVRKANREQGLTVLMVTHDINAAALHADRIGVLRAGRFVRIGTPDDIMVNEVLAPVYGTTFAFRPHPDTGMPIILPEASP